MDLDRYLATHRPTWERLDQLTAHGRRGVRRLKSDELAELVQLYQKTSAQLAYARTYFDDPSLNAYLTRLVSGSGALIYGTRPRSWRAFGNFFRSSFPAALWRCRPYLAVSAVFLLLPAVIVGVWVGTSDAALELVAPPAAQEAYVNERFEEYYESERASQFASTVFTNNVRVGILAFASGILFGLPTLYVLALNGAGIGGAAGMFAQFEQLPRFFGLITPHGLLELTAIIIAGGAGLQLGWSLLRPGDRSRITALAEEGRRIIVIVLGLVPVFAVAGLIEGFVTGQPWPTSLRVGIGVLAEVFFLIYAVSYGRAAAAQGFTGALGETDHEGWLRRSA